MSSGTQWEWQSIRHTSSLAVAATVIGLAGGAGAQDSATGFVALGVGAAPEFEGSEDITVVPLTVARIAYQGVQLELEGLGGRLDVSWIDGFGFGPAFNYRPGRDDDVDNDQVAALEEVDGAFEIGGFVRFGQPVGLTSGDEAVLRLDVLADVADGHSGVIGRLSAAYSFRPIEKLGLTVGASTTLVSSDYSETYFSVSPQGSAASGLSVFDADGGINDVGLNILATYQITDRWGVLGVASVSQLVGDAADSPIVDDAGSATQFFAGVGVSYSF